MYVYRTALLAADTKPSKLPRLNLVKKLLYMLQKMERADMMVKLAHSNSQAKLSLMPARGLLLQILELEGLGKYKYLKNDKHAMVARILIGDLSPD